MPIAIQIFDQSSPVETRPRHKLFVVVVMIALMTFSLLCLSDLYLGLTRLAQGNAASFDNKIWKQITPYKIAAFRSPHQ
jgi:hypothetical protein